MSEGTTTTTGATARHADGDGAGCARERDAKEKCEPTCATGRCGRTATTQFAVLLSPGCPDAESTCINATPLPRPGGRLLRAYPNVSAAALHLHIAWLGHLARNCESPPAADVGEVLGIDFSSERPNSIRAYLPVKLRNKWKYLICYVDEYRRVVIPKTTRVSRENFVASGRKLMTSPKVDVSAAEASTSLVNNKSVALPTRSPRVGVTYPYHFESCARTHVHIHTRVAARVVAAGLMQTGSHDDVTDVKLKLTMRGQPGFVGLEFAKGARKRDKNEERENEC
ncbi:hypothetical protein X777_11393 [Ooceraea biroi]|uniref:Uncharacterized protein n=1 Tax=Ooceraea biroi TaxID=2015173 RepID=A0A026W1F5_OOCBI|nr:hypothetical protein X777_11393 [Ooceraea biroi]